MNDRLIARHFAQAGARFLYGLDDESVLVSDGYLALALPRDHRAFDSRRLYPALPDPGAAIGMPHPALNADGFRRMWDDEPHLATVGVRPTDLYRKLQDRWARVFLPIDGQRWAIHVQEPFLDLLGSPFELERLAFRTAGPASPLIVRESAAVFEPIAIIMPCHIHVQLHERNDAAEADALPGWADYAPEEDSHVSVG